MSKHLAAYQHRIIDIVGRAEAVIGADTRPSSQALGKLRWDLARAMNEYQVFKHSRIFDPAIAAGGERGSAASRMREACMAIGSEYRLYVAAWNATNILDNWDDYRAAALTMLARIRAHVDAEMEHLPALVTAPERKAA
ncbi:hypothetical protein [Sphingomonas sp. ID0503]|uniref:hypothetical protein n=1 Tax=Sphingomonas sp. ID0503 TaxID=3399691 RepID=UPI003AFA2CE5